MKIAGYAAMAAVIGMLAAPGGHAAEIKTKVRDISEGKQVVDLYARPRARQRILVLSPPAGQATAAVILFAGGDGDIGIEEDGSIQSGNNFLVRTRGLFFDAGFVTTVFDKPSDQDTLKHNRTENWHVQDVEAVVGYLKNKYSLPIWLVGTSRGTMTVGHAGAKLTKQIGGVAFTSSMNDAAALLIGEITVPALITHHKNDECFVTTPDAATDIAKGLVKAPKVQVMWFDGGEARGRECGPMSHHGYLGIEDDVVTKIAAFIRANLKK